MTAPRVLPILQEEAARNGYTPEELVAISFDPHTVAVRQYAIWRARRETGRSWGEIGRVFQRDHSTAIHAYEKIEALPPEQRGVFPPRRPPKPPKRARKAAERPPALKKIKREIELYEGSPCPHGHNVRYVSTGHCVECARARNRQRWARLSAMKFAAE